MTQLGPFKIVSLEPGMADVVDRRTGKTVGYLLQNFYGNWEPMADGHPVDEPYQYRRDAAWVVWRRRVRKTEDTVAL